MFFILCKLSSDAIHVHIVLSTLTQTNPTLQKHCFHWTVPHKWQYISNSFLPNSRRPGFPQMSSASTCWASDPRRRTLTSAGRTSPRATTRSCSTTWVTSSTDRPSSAPTTSAVQSRLWRWRSPIWRWWLWSTGRLQVSLFIFLNYMYSDNFEMLNIYFYIWWHWRRAIKHIWSLYGRNKNTVVILRKFGALEMHRENVYLPWDRGVVFLISLSIWFHAKLLGSQIIQIFYNCYS